MRTGVVTLLHNSAIYTIPELRTPSLANARLSLAVMASVAQNGLAPKEGLAVQTPQAHVDSLSKQNDGFSGYESESADEEGEYNETKIAILEAIFLLHTEIPFFLKNITRVLKQSLSLFDAKEPDGLKQQAGAGNVIVDNKSSTIKGHALVRGTRLAKANLSLVPQGKRSLFKTEMLQNESIVLPQAVGSRNYTQRALEGARAWLHACSVFQQNKGEFGSLTKKETIRVVFHHLEKSQIALEELSREVSAARAVLSSASTLHFPSLDAVSKAFHSSPIPKHIALSFDLYESDLQIIMYVLQPLSLKTTATIFARSPFRSKKSSKSENFESLNEKNSFLIGENVEYGGEVVEVIDQHRGQCHVPSFRSASSSFTSIHRECEFLSEKLSAHLIIIESLLEDDE